MSCGNPHAIPCTEVLSLTRRRLMPSADSSLLSTGTGAERRRGGDGGTAALAGAHKGAVAPTDSAGCSRGGVTR